MAKQCKDCGFVNHDFTHVCAECGVNLDNVKKCGFMDKFKRLFRS